MTFRQCFKISKETLQGLSRLNLPWIEEQPIYESASSLTMTQLPDGSVELLYTWSHENVDQLGRLVVTESDSGTASATWIDTWHQSDSPLKMCGEATEAGFVLDGMYFEDEAGQWNWRIELRIQQGGYHLKMFNIEPSGEEVWAVECLYQ